MTIKVALVGVGNCAAALVAGCHYYKQHPMQNGHTPVGVANWNVGGYTPADLEFVAAFDVAAEKVGKDLADALTAGTNCTHIAAQPPHMGVKVTPGPVGDGIGTTYREMVPLNESGKWEWVEEVLRAAQPDVIVNYLPVGSEGMTHAWANMAIKVGAAFVNTIPVFISNDPYAASEFTDAGIPLVGDDIKSQVGATIIHRQMVALAKARGATIDRTYQLNFGGNMDFANMLDKERLGTKKKSKTGAVHAELDAGDEALREGNTHISPSDMVPWLFDEKWAYIRVEGRAWGGAPFSEELKLKVWDSPNSAGVVVDAVRAAKIALDRGEGGPLYYASAWCMKSPPKQIHDEDALSLFLEWANGQAAGEEVMAGH